jgi:imidazole glycerol-phosphate synthase subunit HisH
MSPLAVIDSGGANLASLVLALERLRVPCTVTRDAAVVRAAPRVLLPGVGSAADAMQRLRASGLDRVIPELSQPVLGICLGMQLLFEHSAEGDTRCLGIVAGSVERLVPERGLPVPHMGWNTLEHCAPDPLLAGVGDGTWFYFVHSYAAAANTAAMLAQAVYGPAFAAVIRQRNFTGVQFHPERSGPAGARLLANFSGVSACA